MHAEIQGQILLIFTKNNDILEVKDLLHDNKKRQFLGLAGEQYHSVNILIQPVHHTFAVNKNKLS